MVQRHMDAPAGPADGPVRPPVAAPAAPVQRQADASSAPVRPTLGKPLRELPAGAAPFAPSAREAGPAHPAP
ncbi:MinD/ParA family protein, partial [Streptomyces sp. SID2563]|nr:MinD/ParA family protein [Streptomyces sp. SID2563]